MTLHVVHLADCAPQPWRNGGGRTRELLAWPAPRDWRLRVSVADVDDSGPFSAFVGIVRWFAIVEGAGVRLELPAGARTIGPGDEPLRFDGEAAPTCRLIEGPTRDLNLMTRRDAGTATMRRAAPGSSIEPATRWRGLYAADALHVERDGVTEALAAGTLLWSDEADATTWRLPAHESPRRAWWLTLED